MKTVVFLTPSANSNASIVLLTWVGQIEIMFFYFYFELPLVADCRTRSDTSQVVEFLRGPLLVLPCRRVQQEAPMTRSSTAAKTALECCSEGDHYEGRTRTRVSLAERSLLPLTLEQPGL